jgi:DNA ligase D-like protein (predicted 3'-phosphoesterase)
MLLRHPSFSFYSDGMKYGVIILICLLVAGKECMGSLKTYRKKRDFEKTTEPAGVQPPRKSAGTFVIQQHAARAMHYDVRLEIGGVLVSWAVPKGPSLNPAIKRLAIMTEDHPQEYAHFEGIIPSGEYGAGPVIIWDHGTYTNIKEKNGKTIPMQKCLRDGQLEVAFQGEKLHGGFAFIRTDASTKEKSRWLLIKMRDEYVDARRSITTAAPASVTSGKTIKQLHATPSQKRKRHGT